MAIQGNDSGLLDVLHGAAGKNNYGAGGDFYTPGRHVVKVTETVVGKSENKKGIYKAIMGAQVLESVGGESNWVKEGDKAVRRGEPQAVPAIGIGSSRKQILMSDKGNWDSDLGNFCLAVKKTFAVMYRLCEEMGMLEDFLKERWPKSAHDRIQAFVERAEANSDVTVKEDITDIFTFDLAVGLIMHVDCGDKANKDKTFVINQVSWRASTADELSKFLEGAE